MCFLPVPHYCYRVKGWAKDCNLQWARLRRRPRQVRRLAAGEGEACSLSNPVSTKREAGGLKPSKVPGSYISRKSRAINRLGGKEAERSEHVHGSCWHCLLFYSAQFFSLQPLPQPPPPPTQTNSSGCSSYIWPRCYQQATSKQKSLI